MTPTHEEREAVAQAANRARDQFDTPHLRDAFRANPRQWLAYSGISDGLTEDQADTVVGLVLEAWT